MTQSAPFRIGSNRDAVNATTLEMLELLTAATNVESCWSTLIDDMSLFGFDRLFYGNTRQYTEKSLGPKDDILVLSNHTVAYIDGFIGTNRYLDAPLMAWARKNVGSISWSWVTENRHTLNERQLEVLEFNQTHDVTAGYTMSFSDSVSRNRTALALTAPAGVSQLDVDRCWQEYGREINMLSRTAHLVFTTLPWPSVGPRLSARQKEVLQWVADGKTAAEIAVILDLKPATIEKHLKMARQALNVETTAQAIMKVSIYKQIFALDPRGSASERAGRNTES